MARCVPTLLRLVSDTAGLRGQCADSPAPICHGFLLSLQAKSVFNLWLFELTIRPRIAAGS